MRRRGGQKPHHPSPSNPSLLDAVYTSREETVIAAGHQAGENLHDEVSGTPSAFHVFARIAI